jgi:hypothetical protein
MLCTPSTVSALPSTPIVQVRDPIVNVWPESAGTMDLGKATI